MLEKAVAFGVLFATIVTVYYLRYYHSPSCIEVIESSSGSDDAEGLNIVHTVELPYERHLYRQFAQMARDKVSHSSPALVSLARRLLDPPAPGPFNPENHLYNPHRLNPYAQVVDKILGGMTGGFFVEVGGFDGITASNTVHLEQLRGWRGLLIEADPNLYLKLRAHNRACWSINAAVGIKPHADTIAFYPDPQLGQLGRLGNVSHEVKGASRGRVVPMFPLATLLRALNVSTVHFFSLDVEGLELQVLQSLPWAELDIRVLLVEFKHGSGPNPLAEYAAFMVKHGYQKHSTTPYDVIFVKEK